MVSSKIFASVLGLASLAVVGVSNAAPTELSVAQMDGVTAAGVASNNGNHYGDHRGKGHKYGQSNFALQSNIALVAVVGEDITINGGIHIQQSNRLTQVNR